MITLDTHLMSLVNKEIVDPDEAVEKAQDPEAMRTKLTGMGFKLREV
jgi:twitching motility protein PilT